MSTQWKLPVVLPSTIRLPSTWSEAGPYIAGAAVVAAVPLAVSLFNFMDPVLRKLIFGGDFDYAAIRDERLSKGRAYKSLGIVGRQWVLTGEHAAKWLLWEQKHNVLAGTSPGIESVVGGSIITQNGAAHANTRRLMTPAFRSDVIRSYVPGVLKTTLNEMEYWATVSAKGNYLDIENELKQLALRFALTLLIGAEIPDEEHELSGQLAKSYEHLFDGTLPWPIGNWDGKQKSKEAREKILKDVEAIIEKRLERLATGYQPTDMDPLWLLIKAKDEDGNSLSIPELANHALLLVIAGHETTARILGSFAIKCIQHPTILARIREEQDALKKGSANITEADLKCMPYLDAVFREIERLEPPVPFTSRVAMKDLIYTPIDNKKPVVIEKGSTISWDMGSTNRDPLSYPNPDSFMPERWLTPATTTTTDEAEASDLGTIKISNYKLATFGAGHRVCMGMMFARMEMLVVGAVLVRDYEFSEVKPGSKIQKDLPIFLNKKVGAMVRFNKRSVGNY
ncbi:hypothetical protein HK097_003359 [Rhizophlyctis rosea]|uniref:ATP-dependent DNA ligase family profile domain-containing protein n=1 Tax=Rhizophlyctis rosea TaxID=64517 RepID=A0AAD5SGM4_9FUNG|nr:hypothetical protein HK097_003359 [Rhizophlyctis rosea]